METVGKSLMLYCDLRELCEEGICKSLTAVVAVEPASAHSTVLRKDAAMGQDGHACMASAETSRNSFAVVPLAA